MAGLTHFIHRLSLSPKQARLLKRHLSLLFIPPVLLSTALPLIPFALHSDPLENLTPLKGKFSSLQASRSMKGNYTFIFKVKERRETFRVTGLATLDQELFATETIGNEVRFSVAEATLASGAESNIPVIELATDRNTYLRSETGSVLRKSRYLAGFCAVTFLLIAAAMLLRLRRLYNSSKEEDTDAFDPIVVAVARHPLKSAALLFGLVYLPFALILPLGLKMPALGVFASGYLIFWLWFRKKGKAIAWLQAAAKGNVVLAERPQTLTPKHVQAVEMLTKSGRDVNIQDPLGRTPLFIAAERNRVEAVDLLLRCGAQVNLADSNKITPIMIAAEKGFLGVVTKLIAAGADLLVQDDIGENALAHAQRNKKNRGTVEYLTRATTKAEAEAKAKAEAEAKAKEEAAAKGEAPAAAKAEPIATPASEKAPAPVAASQAGLSAEDFGDIPDEDLALLVREGLVDPPKKPR